MRAACGCGGTVKDSQIEIQGDQRETVARILRRYLTELFRLSGNLYEVAS